MTAELQGQRKPAPPAPVLTSRVHPSPTCERTAVARWEDSSRLSIRQVPGPRQESYYTHCKEEANRKCNETAVIKMTQDRRNEKVKSENLLQSL